MNDHSITRLVVGEAMTLTIGVPVGQRIQEHDVSKTIRWRNGRWENNESLVNKLRKAASKSTDVLAVPTTSRTKPKINFLAILEKAFSSRKAKMAAWCGIAFIATTAIIYAGLKVYRGGIEEAVFLPVPNNEAVINKDAVRTVEVPFVRAAEEQPAEQLTDVPTIPASPAQPQQPIAAQIPKVEQATAAAQAPKVPPQVPPSPKQESKPAQPAGMILDADGASNKATHQVDHPVAVKEAPKPTQGTGLVAVTPDGKIALFTNPKTRLPERFSVGDKLPSGEVIKSIDKAGKVVTDAKEYRLE